jgi:hypothetical protein
LRSTVEDIKIAPLAVKLFKMHISGRVILTNTVFLCTLKKYNTIVLYLNYMLNKKKITQHKRDQLSMTFNEPV